MGLHYCCRAILSSSFVPICPCIEARLVWRNLSTSIEAFLMLVVMSLSWWRGARPSNSSPGMWLASLRMRSVGSLSDLDSSASHGQWLNCDRRRWAWACAVNPLSESLFMTRVRCSIPICVALSRMGGRPRPASFRVFCTPSEGKFGRRPIACLIALFRIPSMVLSCLSLNTPRCVAWYLDFRSCSIANVLSGGLSFRFASALASFLTSLVMWRKCSLKSSMGLMWTPSIFFNFFLW